MKDAIFYGAAIQGTRGKERNERAKIHRAFIDSLKSIGYDVPLQHTAGRNKEECLEILASAIGPLPSDDTERAVYVRQKTIDIILGDIKAAVFEVSVPSTGTGMEIAYASMRVCCSKRGLKNVERIPILALYEKDYWSNKLSIMVRGISKEEIPNFYLKEYIDISDGKQCIAEFLSDIKAV